MIHQPVMTEEIVSFLGGFHQGTIIDGTLGEGGHSEALLLATSPDIRIIGIDRDPDAVRASNSRLGKFGTRFSGYCANFGDFQYLEELCLKQIPVGFLMDLGLSSRQLDKDERGFSFNSDSLDMRFNPEEGALTAYEIVNFWSEAELSELFHNLGEERFSRRVARAIVKTRQIQVIESARHLAEVVRKSCPSVHQERIHPATRVFQALRIRINEELVWIRKGLETAEKLLSPKGRLAVISFHSLEDRIVKDFLRSRKGICCCPKEIPVCRCHPVHTFQALTAKPLTPGAEEIRRNPRARSAKLRVAERLESQETAR